MDEQKLETINNTLKRIEELLMDIAYELAKQNGWKPEDEEE